jgi:hypothetical protein
VFPSAIDFRLVKNLWVSSRDYLSIEWSIIRCTTQIGSYLAYGKAYKRQILWVIFKEIDIPAIQKANLP